MATSASNKPTEETVTVSATELSAMQAMIRELQADKENRDAEKKALEEAAAKAGGAIVEPEFITPAGTKTPEDTFIAYRHSYTDKDGVQQTKDYRMKSEDFATISAERGW